MKGLKGVCCVLGIFQSIRAKDWHGKNEVLIRRLWPLVAFLFFGLVLSGQSLAKQGSVHLPRTIAGMNLEGVIDGAKAAQIINRMHRTEVATRTNAIGQYRGRGQSATYYVSVYEDPGQAKQAMKDMARVIAEGGHGFVHLRQRMHGEKLFYMTLGQGQAHYFFARDVELIWLAVDKGIAEEAILDLLSMGSGLES
jgi:hypothetical protein